MLGHLCLITHPQDHSFNAMACSFSYILYTLKTYAWATCVLSLTLQTTPSRQSHVVFHVL